MSPCSCHIALKPELTVFYRTIILITGNCLGRRSRRTRVSWFPYTIFCKCSLGDPGLPDTIGTATIVPSSTSSLAVSMSTSAQPEGLPTSSSPVTPIPKPGPSHTKGVVGGVIGACIGLIIITSAIFLCRRRYRKKQVHRNPSLAIQTHEHYEVKCVATPSTSDVFFPPPLHGCVCLRIPVIINDRSRLHFQDPFKAEPRSSVSESVSRSFEECEIADNQYFGKVPRFQRVPTLMSV